MNKKRQFFALLFVTFALITGFFLVQPASANPEAQVYYFTPTPQPDGRVIYTVKDGDSCISIALLNNVSEEQLRRLNDLTGDDCMFLQIGQQLLLDIVEQQPTAGPSPTPTSLLPTPTPNNGTGDICVLLFDDINGNGLLDDDSNEYPLSGGAININGRNGAITFTSPTFSEDTEDDEENTAAVCFEGQPEGKYTISVGVPDGYNPTMRTSATVDLLAGNTIVVDFGAQVSSMIEEIPGEPVEENKSPFLGVMGIFVFIAGIGIAVYAIRVNRK